MARKWLWNCGWEAGRIRRSGAAESNKAWVASEQDLWETTSSAPENPATVTPRSGQYKCKVIGVGFGLDPQFVGHYTSFSGSGYLWWFTPFQYHRAQGLSSDIQANDDYLIARMAVDFDAAGGVYLALGIRLTTAGNDTSYKIGVYLMNANGTFNSTIAFSASTYSKSTTAWHVPCLQIDMAANQWSLYVDGVLEAGPANAGAAIKVAPILRDNRLIRGKGSDVNLLLYVDDWGACESASAADIPGVNDGKVVLYQPNADVDKGWTPTGDATNHYRNVDDENDDAPGACDYNRPTGVTQTESFGFPDVAGGTVEGVRVLWEQHGVQGGSGHPFIARLDPADSWSTLSGAKTGYKTVTETPCGGGGTDLFWHGRQVSRAEDIKAGQGDWDNPDFDGLQVGHTSNDTDAIGELYVMAVGNSLVMPGPTPPAPPAAAFVPRVNIY